MTNHDVSRNSDTANQSQVLGVRGLITDGARLLMVSNHWVPGYYVLPGGGVEPGESLTQALQREILEELGVEAKIGSLLAVHQIEDDGTFTPPGFIFHITNGDDFMDINLMQTTHGQAEIDEVKFSDELDLLLPQEVASLLPEFIAEDFNGPTRMIISPAIEIN